MPRFGSGFGTRRHRLPPRKGSAAPPLVSPAQAWNGTAGAGFALAPADPVRTTAKPAMRLIVPPNQAFTNEILVGVAAFANNGGTLFDNLGITKVVAHYEGSSCDIVEPSFQTFNDANGVAVTYFGWWARLKHDGRNGDAQLYFQAVPKDGTMQSRVMGPYLFMPSATLHDLELTVAPSLPVVTGSRYQSIAAALTYSAAQGKHRPHIVLTEQRNDYVLGQLTATPFSHTSGKGYATVEASVPVRIVSTSYVDAQPRTKFDGLRFKGANITIDHALMSLIYHEGIGNQHWFDGVTIINSAGRNAINPVLGGAKQYGVARNNPWFTETTVSGIPNTFNSASLIRGCTVTGGYGDLFTDSRCAIGNRVDNYSAYESLAEDIPAFTVIYNGAGTTATLQMDAVFGDPGTATFVAKIDGATAGSFTVTRSGSGYTPVSSVVNWLNSLPGWTAVLQNNTRRATACSLAGMKGVNFGAKNVKGIVLQVVTMFDWHGDVWQHLIGGIPENVIVADNVVTNFAGQCIFISSTTPARDFVFVNNSFHGLASSGTYNKKSDFYCQFGRSGTKSHVVAAHNSLTQGWLLRPAEGFTADAYCLLANNALASLLWNGTPNPNIRLYGNHLLAGATEPVNGIATTVGGTEAELWPSAQAGDFSPHGILVTSPRTPAMRFDKKRRRRSGLDAAGSDAI